MQIIGFNLTKIHSERFPNVDLSSLHINTNIEFTNVEKEKLEILKESESLKLSFKFSVNYIKKNDKKEEEQAKINFEGFMILSPSNEELKEILKEWKKKQLPQKMRLPFVNLILKRCSVRAMQLEEELGVPTHISIPQLVPQAQQQKQ